MVQSELTYEECRRQRVEENKKRMQELNLTNLALAFKPKSSHAKQAKPKARLSDKSLMPVRRSVRVADKPPTNYKEIRMEALVEIRRSRRHVVLHRGQATDKVRKRAYRKAEILESELGSEFPTFIKTLSYSHVAKGFWMGLPAEFCNEHMPDEDSNFNLVDEDDDEWNSKYLAVKRGLSGGWRAFAIDHRLEDGDALVFQLVRPTEFKVYIIRTGQSDNAKVRGGSRKTRARRRKNQSDEETDDETDESEEYESEESSKETEVTALSRRTSRRTRESQSDEDDDDDDDAENDESEDSIEVLEVTTSSQRSSRRTRTRKSQSDDENDETKENIDVVEVTASSQKTSRRTSQSDDENDETKENIDVVEVTASSRRTSRRTRASQSDDENDETKENIDVVEVTASSRRTSTRTRMSQSDVDVDDGVKRKENVGFAASSESTRRTRARKK